RARGSARRSGRSHRRRSRLSQSRHRNAQRDERGASDGVRMKRSSFRSLALLVAVAATYPIALAGHLATEWLFGDALLLRELQYGAQRAAAAAVLAGWWKSL